MGRKKKSETNIPRAELYRREAARQEAYVSQTLNYIETRQKNGSPVSKRDKEVFERTIANAQERIAIYKEKVQELALEELQ